MIRRGYNQIKSELQRNFRSKEFSVVLSGEYSRDDADWNYKDVPHLNIVHSQVDSLQAWIAQEAIATINFQKIFFLTIPMVVFNYDAGKYNQVYFTSFGPIMLLVNTVTRGDDKACKVTTNYCLFAKSPFHWFFPILQRLILRNNSILMSEDTPMRNRRGILRRAGHTFFSPTETYGYSFTTEIHRNNVRLTRKQKSVCLAMVDLVNPRIKTVGEGVGILSFRVHREKNVVSIWATTCPHEGAELTVDQQCLKRGFVECPWHGRRLAPVCVIQDGKLLRVNERLPYKVDFETESVTITYVGDSEGRLSA